MAPVERAPKRAIRIVLIKQVILALPENRPVWIIHPIGRCEEVIKRPVPVLGEADTQRVERRILGVQNRAI